MFPNYLAALQGTLVSTPSGNPRPMTFWNNLTFDVWLSYVSEFGTLVGLGPLPAGYSITYEVNDGIYVLWQSLHTGSFVGLVEAAAGMETVFFGKNYVLAPNDIGPPPSPTSDIPVPQDSSRVLVGFGELDNQNRVLREQYWRRMPDSFSLAPGETRGVSSTTTSNLQQVSSDTTTVAASVGANASAGWGPFSIGVSASLNASSTSFQQFTVSEEYSAYVTDTVQNQTSEAQMFLKWQLMDMVSILDVQGVILSTVVNGTSPVLIAGPFSLSALPPSAVALRRSSTSQIAYPLRRISPRR